MGKTEYKVVKVKLRKKKKGAKQARQNIQNKNASSINILIGTQRRYTGDRVAPNTKSTGTIRNPNRYNAPAYQNPILFIPVDQGTAGSVLPSNKRYIPGDYNKPPSDIEQSTYPTNIKKEKSHQYIQTEPRQQTNFNDRDGAGIGGNTVPNPSFVGGVTFNLSDYQSAAETKEMETGMPMTESSENDVQGDQYYNIGDENVTVRNANIPTSRIEESPDTILARSNVEYTPQINQNSSSVQTMSPDSLSKLYSTGEGKNLLVTPKSTSSYLSWEEGVTPGVMTHYGFGNVKRVKVNENPLSPFSELERDVNQFKQTLFSGDA